MWRIQDGYLQGPPEDIAQTRDGYLWIGTALGLLRFDGVRFVPWASLTAERLPNNHIFSLLGSSDGSLWIGTLKGLARWKDGQVINYKELPDRINGIAEDRQGNIWIARSEVTAQDHRGALCRVSGTAVQCFGDEDGIFLKTGMGLTIDAAGNIWIFGYQGLCKWNNGLATSYFQKELAGHGYLIGVAALAVQNEEHFWVAVQQANGNLELREFDHGKWRVQRLPTLGKAAPSTNVLFLDTQGMLWVGTASDGMYRISANKVDHFSNADGLSSDSVGRFFEDREGLLWLASTKGIDSFRDLPVVSFSIKEGLASDSVSSILASRDGGVWIGGAEALGFLKQDELSAIHTNHGLPGRDITTMFEDSLGRLWIGVDTNLALLEKGQFLPIRRPDGGPLGVIFAVAEDTAHNEWVVTERELFGVESQKVRWRIALPQKAFTIAADLKDGVWLGFENGDLAHYSVGHYESFPADETVYAERIRLLLPEPGGLWAVTTSGLVWWNGNKRTALTTRNGLPCNELYSAVKDTEGALWVYSRCGLFSIAASQLNLFREYQDAGVRVETLDIYDGVQPGSTPLQQQATRSTDGRLWFANNNIVQTFDPRKWRKNTLAPNVITERVVADGMTYFPQQNLRLPALIRNLEIDFTALSFVVPQKVQFRYKLEGRDADWQEAGTRRQAFYTDLPPGSYHFRVIASNNDGVWNEAGASLAFAVAHAWYQTNWFRIGCVGVFLTLMWGLYKLRLQQLRRQFNVRVETRVNERTRIARELHDTLLQSLHGLMFEFQAARNMFQKRPEEALLALDGAIMGTEHAITESQDAIENLRGTTTEDDLVNLIKRTGEELAASHCADHGSPTFGLTVEGQRRTLTPTIRDEVFRIAREVLRNAFRHAKAHRIEAEILYDKDQLRLRVRDDGKGMDAQVLEKGCRPGHWGLPGVRERAQQIGAKLDVWSETGAGTEVQLAIAASVAYGKRSGHSRFRLFQRTGNHDHRPNSNSYSR